VTGLGAGLVVALASALALNWGFWVQHGVASALPRLSVSAPVRSLRLLFAHRRWLAGWSAGLAGWALYVLALRLAPLSLVQAVSAGGVGVLALLAWRVTGARPLRRERVSLVIAVVGLIVLALSLAGSTPHGRHGSSLAVLGWAGSSLVLGTLAVVGASRVLRAGAAFGIGSGLLYAAGDVATKAAVGGGVRLALAALVLACHGLAFVMLQLGFQRGGVLATAGLSSLLTNALPIVAGVVLFGEGVPAGWTGAVRVIGFGAVVLGGAGLARGGPDGAVMAAAPAPAARTSPQWS
jgi:hypothetical protein